MASEEQPQPLVAATGYSEKAAIQDGAKAKSVSSAEQTKEAIIDAGEDGDKDKTEEQGGARDYIVNAPPPTFPAPAYIPHRRCGATPNLSIACCIPLASSPRLAPVPHFR
jgi:hypothetical protein